MRLKATPTDADAASVGWSPERKKQAFQLAAFFAGWLALVLVCLFVVVDPAQRVRYAVKFGVSGIVLLIAFVSAWRRGPEAMKRRPPPPDPEPREGQVSRGGLREALAVVLGTMMIVLGVLVLVTQGDASALWGVGLGALIFAGGLSEHRRARRAQRPTPADTSPTATR